VRSAVVDLLVVKEGSEAGALVGGAGEGLGAEVVDSLGLEN